VGEVGLTLAVPGDLRVIVILTLEVFFDGV
jgi:hypothetical protein